MSNDQLSEKDVRQWLTSLDEGEIEEFLHNLTLKREGEYFDKIARLHRWLRGDYSAPDFNEDGPTDAMEAKQRRCDIRRNFLQTFLHEKTGTTLMEPEVNHDLPHPLSIYFEVDERSFHEINRGRQIGSASQAGDGTPDGSVIEDSSSRAILKIQKDIAGLAKVVESLVDGIRRVNERVDALSNDQRDRYPASSTRRYPEQEYQQVDFRNTYTVHGNETSTPEYRGRFNDTRYPAQRNTASNQQSSWRGGEFPILEPCYEHGGRCGTP